MVCMLAWHCMHAPCDSHMITCVCAYNKWLSILFKDIIQPINALILLYAICAIIFTMWDYLFLNFLGGDVTWCEPFDL